MRFLRLFPPPGRIRAAESRIGAGLPDLIKERRQEVPKLIFWGKGTNLSERLSGKKIFRRIWKGFFRFPISGF